MHVTHPDTKSACIDTKSTWIQNQHTHVMPACCALPALSQSNMMNSLSSLGCTCACMCMHTTYTQVSSIHTITHHSTLLGPHAFQMYSQTVHIIPVACAWMILVLPVLQCMITYHVDYTWETAGVQECVCMSVCESASCSHL
jgi:hypothetical protein